MSRPIKFRCWDATTKKWLTDVEMMEKSIWGLREMAGVLTYPWKIELMQFTGLTDKNGTEIYEGDILSTSNDLTSNYEIRYSKEHGGFFAYAFNHAAKKKFSKPAASESVLKLEVIGNIYENKELLK